MAGIVAWSVVDHGPLLLVEKAPCGEFEESETAVLLLCAAERLMWIG